MIKNMTVTRVEALPAFKLQLAFSDGSEGIADLSKDLDGPLFPLMEDPALFKQAHVHRGAVVWSDDLDVATEFLYARAHRLAPPRTTEEVSDNELAVTLKELRTIAGRSQVEVASEMGVAQGEISRLERRGDTRFSTLQRYVEALGGELEVVARFGNKTMKLHVG